MTFTRRRFCRDVEWVQVGSRRSRAIGGPDQGRANSRDRWCFWFQLCFGLRNATATVVAWHVQLVGHDPVKAIFQASRSRLSPLFRLRYVQGVSAKSAPGFGDGKHPMRWVCQSS